MATTDCQAAEKEPGEFRILHRKTFAVLNKMWNQYNQSNKFAELVQEKFSKALVTPSPTRWNSLFDSVQRVLQLKEEDNASFQTLFAFSSGARKDSLRPLQLQEWSFLQEWAQVMEPVASALDFLQGEEDRCLGHLLPTVTELQRQLEEARDRADKCKPLAEAALAGVRKRFDACFESREMLLASAYLPGFKTDFLSDSNKAKATRVLLEEAAAVQVMQAPTQVSSREGFFGKRERKTDSAETEVKRFLADESDDITTVLAYKRIKKIFLRVNVIMPTSAPSERLFSGGRNIMRYNRMRMSDKSFETQLLLSVNKMY